jgi:hypothetical protein
MALVPAFALSDEVAAKHKNDATKHDEVRPDVFRCGLKDQHGPDEGVHCTHTK